MLTTIITTFNETDHIESVLDSVSWTDEVIVVDSFSEDNTVELARSKGAKILQRKYTGPADQKNWAIPHAHYEWILILDADERVTPELKTEILSLLNSKKPLKDAYWIGRTNYFMDKKIRYSGWQGDKVIRLIRRDKCRYDEKQVHEEIETIGIQVGQLKAKLEHYTYKNLQHYLDKTRRYAEWSAQDYFTRTKKISWFHLWLKPLFRFCKHFIWQGGFLDGKEGYVISKIMAWGVFLRYLKIKELQAAIRKK